MKLLSKLSILSPAVILPVIASPIVTNESWNIEDKTTNFLNASNADSATTTHYSLTYNFNGYNIFSGGKKATGNRASYAVYCKIGIFTLSFDCNIGKIANQYSAPVMLSYIHDKGIATNIKIDIDPSSNYIYEIDGMDYPGGVHIPFSNNISANYGESIHPNCAAAEGNLWGWTFDKDNFWGHTGFNFSNNIFTATNENWTMSGWASDTNLTPEEKLCNVSKPSSNCPFQTINNNAFDKNKLLAIDWANTYYDDTICKVKLKPNYDYIACDLMAWDVQKHQLSKYWSNNAELNTFLKMDSDCLAVVDGAIQNGQLINQQQSTVVDYHLVINGADMSTLNPFDNPSAVYSLLDFLKVHHGDTLDTLKAAVASLKQVKWWTDMDQMKLDITSAIPLNNYPDMVEALLNQDLTYTLNVVSNTGSQPTPATLTKPLIQLMTSGWEISCASSATPTNNEFVFHTDITNNGAFGTLGTTDNLGMIDVEQKQHNVTWDGKTDYKIDISRLMDSNAVQTIDGNPHDTGAGLFVGNTGWTDTSDAAFIQLEQRLWTKLPSDVKGYLDVGKVPAADSTTGADVPFDKSCFVEPKTGSTSTNINDYVDHIDWVANDTAGSLTGTIHYKDEAAGDAPSTLTVNLFAKQVSITKYARTAPVNIEPSQIDGDFIKKNCIKYADTTLKDGNDLYLFETNLTQGEFDASRPVISCKVQDDKNGKLDVLFTINDRVYQMNWQGEPTPDTATFDIVDTDFVPTKPVGPSGGHNKYLWMEILFPILGVVLIFGLIIGLKNRKRKFNTSYDEDDDESNALRIQQKREAKRHPGKEVVLESDVTVAKPEAAAETAVDTPMKKTFGQKVKSFLGIKSKKKPPVEDKE